ncbi:MAG: hypothetical protein UH850_16400 [Paludibacteraceae bacterium]|nr:hypothetical protein [Paludibacteraceae bacterium]
MITTIGVVMTIIGLFIFFNYEYSYLVAFLIVTCISQVTAVFATSDSGVLLSVLGCILVIFRSLLLTDFGIYKTRFAFLILIFGIYSFLVSIIGPYLFNGLSVVGTNLDDAVLFGYDELSPSMIHIGSFFTFFLRLFTLVCIWQSRIFVDNKIIRDGFLVAVFLSLFFGFWEFSSKMSGYLIPFPSSILYNCPNSGIVIGQLYTGANEALGERMRMSSLCSEASFFGVFLAASFWSCFSMTSFKAKLFYLLLILLASVCTLSGAGIISLVLGGLTYIFLGKKDFYFLLKIIVIFVGFYWVFQLDEIQNLLLNKSDSQSGVVRLETTLNSINVFFESYFMGIGWNYTRSSSFLFDTLAAVGVFGTLTFVYVCSLMIKPILKDRSASYILWYCFVLFLGQIIAIPDFRFTFFWLGLFMLVSYNPYKNKYKHAICNS